VGASDGGYVKTACLLFLKSSLGMPMFIGND
jgi:hypothetical protein